MNQSALKLTILLLASLFAYSAIYAQDEKNPEIKLKRDNKPGSTFKPKAPEYVPVTCYYDGEALTFVSSYDTEAEIIVTDSFTSAVIAHETAQLTPEYTVSIAGAESFDITLTLEDGSILYGSY